MKTDQINSDAIGRNLFEAAEMIQAAFPNEPFGLWCEVGPSGFVTWSGYVGFMDWSYDKIKSRTYCSEDCTTPLEVAEVLKQKHASPDARRALVEARKETLRKELQTLENGTIV